MTEQTCYDCDRETPFLWWADRDGSPVQVCWDCLTTRPRVAP